jgi:DNA-binding GntR family transcriptional regulator
MTERVTLSAHIFTTLKQRIIRWDYPPGHHLTEEELCQEFGVSRVPVREALRMLAENGLVDKAPHRGCMVKQPDLVEIHELYDVRLALELFVVTQLTQRSLLNGLSQELAAPWRARLHTPANAEIDSGQLAVADAEFHEALARATGNRLLYEHLRQIDERLHFTRLTDITTGERLRITCEQHLHLLDCICAGDALAAQEAIRTNIEFGRTHVEWALKEALARAYLQSR